MRDSRVPRWNGAPSQDLLVIRRSHDTGVVTLDPLRWASSLIGRGERRTEDRSQIEKKSQEAER